MGQIDDWAAEATPVEAIGVSRATGTPIHRSTPPRGTPAAGAQPPRPAIAPPRRLSPPPKPAKVVMGVRIPEVTRAQEEAHPRADRAPDDDRLTVTGMHIPEELRHVPSPASLPPTASAHEQTLALLKWNASATAATTQSLGRFMAEHRSAHEQIDRNQDRSDRGVERLENVVGSLQSAVAGLQAVVSSVQATLTTIATGARTAKRAAKKVGIGAVLVAVAASAAPKGCELVCKQLERVTVTAAPAAHR